MSHFSSERIVEREKRVNRLCKASFEKVAEQIKAYGVREGQIERSSTVDPDYYPGNLSFSPVRLVHKKDEVIFFTGEGNEFQITITRRRAEMMS